MASLYWIGGKRVNYLTTQLQEEQLQQLERKMPMNGSNVADRKLPRLENDVAPAHPNIRDFPMLLVIMTLQDIASKDDVSNCAASYIRGLNIDESYGIYRIVLVRVLLLSIICHDNSNNDGRKQFKKECEHTIVVV